MEPITSLLKPSLFPLAEVSEDIGWNILWYVGFSMLVVLVIFQLAKRGVTNRVFIGLPARATEHLVVFIESIAVGVIGPGGRKYVPLLIALWTFIFVSNVFGLVFNFTPTAEWSLNISLAVITMVYVQWEGIRANGLFGHLKHFSGPKMVGIMVCISVLLFFIELVSEFMKLFSLSIRLYGNIHGGHQVVSSLNDMAKIPLAGHEFPIPLGGLLLPLKFLTCILQAYVFVTLTATYLSLVTHHDEEHEAHGDEHGHAPAVVAA